MAKLARLLNLTAALLDTRTPLTAEEIRTRVDGYPDGDVAFHRAFERDKDDLRELGVPVETVTVNHLEVPKAGYTIDEDQYSLEDPGFSGGELAALQLARATVLFEGLDADEVEDTFRKLGGVQGDSAKAEVVGSIPVSADGAVILEAIARRRTLHFIYSETERTLEPASLQFDRGRWYLSGFDRTRGQQRNFRVDRIRDLSAGQDQSFEPGDRPNALITSPWAAGDESPTEARILLDREPAQATLAEYPDLRVVEQGDDASVIVIAQVRNSSGLYAFMAGLLERAEILDPPQLRSGYIEWLRDRLDMPDQQLIVDTTTEISEERGTEGVKR